MALSTINNVQMAVGDTLADRPVTPAEMLVFLDKLNDVIWFYDGTTWVIIGSGSGGGGQGDLNVVALGADSSGDITKASSNTAIIQSAADALNAIGGGRLYFPTGHYYINNVITLHNNTRVEGSQASAALIEQTDSTKGVFLATDALHITIQYLRLKSSTGVAPSTGIGIHFTRSTRTSNYIALRDLELTNFSSDGVRFDDTIVTVLENVFVNTVRGHGFNMLSTTTNITSVSFIGCYALQCDQAGYNLNSVVYSELNGCASDSNGIGYLVTNSSCVALNACAAESCRNVDATYAAIAFKISGSTDIKLTSCLNSDNTNISFWITGSSSRTELDLCREVSQGVGAANSVLVDAGCSRISIMHKNFLSAMSLAVKTTNFPMSETTVLKTASQFVTNSTTLVDDNALFISVDANSVYEVEGFIIYNASTTGNIKLGFTGPTSVTLDWTIDGVVLAAGATSGSILRAAASIGDANVQTATGAGVPMVLKVRGVLTVAATAGNLQMRWAQNTVDAGVSTSVRVNSFLRVKQIA